MTIGVASDHRGYNVKEMLKGRLSEYDIIDYGTNSEEPTDFPVYAKKLGDGILSHEVDFGIAICGTGIGMSIALNKMKGIYCAKVSTASEDRLAKAHNDANAIAISEELPEELIMEIVTDFINTPFSNVNKYVKRNDMIKEIENA